MQSRKVFFDPSRTDINVIFIHAYHFDSIGGTRYVSTVKMHLSQVKIPHISDFGVGAISFSTQGWWSIFLFAGGRGA